MDHGVSVNEIPTGVVPPVSVTAGLPVYVGVAPINLGDPSLVNKPVLLNELADGANKLGFIDGVDWGKWSLLEAISAHFKVYGVGPIVCINVIDPNNAAHILHAVGESHVLDSKGQTTLQIYGEPKTFGVLKSTVVVKVGGVTKTLGTDYTLAFDANGFLVVTRVATGTIAAGATITVDYTYLDPDGVVAADIIGGYSAGSYKGIAAIDQVFPRLKLPPGLLLSPKWSQEPTVAAALFSKASNVSGMFRAHALVDLSTSIYDIPSSEDAPGWKSDNGYSLIDGSCCWPKFKNGDDVYHLSTVTACIALQTDNANSGIPFASPSNKALIGTAAVLDDGTEVFLTRPQATALNAQGIVTALQGSSGFKLWGNRTAVYPGDTDPKDAFIPVRRMFNWIESTIILTTDRDVDDPMNRRLIDSVMGTVQAFLNGLIAGPQALIDGKIEFRSDENPVTALSDGKIVWHVTLTPPSPAESLDFTVEYDPNALAALFT